jgi:hypothetical protein
MRVDASISAFADKSARFIHLIFFPEHHGQSFKGLRAKHLV